jgi:hypothetical protein
MPEWSENHPPPSDAVLVRSFSRVGGAGWVQAGQSCGLPMLHQTCHHVTSLLLEGRLHGEMSTLAERTPLAGQGCWGSAAVSGKPVVGVTS